MAAIKHVNKTQAREYYSSLRSQGKLSGSVKSAVAKWEQRAERAKQPGPKAGRFARRMARYRQPVIVPLGDVVARRELIYVKSKNPRLREWSLGAVAGESYGWRETGDNSNWHKRSTFQRGLVVDSVAQRLSAREATLKLAGERHDFRLPRGYRWKVDRLGLLIADSRGNDFHPTASDLLQGISHCIQQLKGNAAQRKAEQRKAKQELRILKVAEREGARVCLRDSLCAGNCYAGSESWARQHKLDPHAHVKPSQLLAIANGDTARVAIVVAQSIRRHRTEMSQGYCEVARHRV